MADSSNRGDSIFIHEPLPYVVRVRSVLSEDEPPEVRTFRMFAYSVLEAVIQATFMAGGNGLEDARHRIEAIEPDLAEYIRFVTARALEAAKGARS